MDYGETKVTPQEFDQFLRSISQKYSRGNYHLLHNNCNSFADECLRFLTGEGVPSYVKTLPHRAQSTPQGKALANFANAINDLVDHIPVMARRVGAQMEKTVKSIEQDMKRRGAGNRRDMLQYADQLERSGNIGAGQRYSASSFDPRTQGNFHRGPNQAPVFRNSMRGGGGYNQQYGGYNY